MQPPESSASFPDADLVRQRFELLIDSLEDYAVFMIDLSGVITSWNAGVEQVLGYWQADFVGLPFATLQRKEDEMGAPNIKDALQDNQAAIDAVNAACNATFATLANDAAKGEAFINANSKGIVQTLAKNSLWYSKFSEDFSLDALDKIIDSTVKTVVDAIKLSAGADNPDLAVQTAQDVGSLVKGVLALAASSSSTEENLQVTFSYIVAGDNNFAVYYAYNSATVAAKNVWGSKDITVIANTYVTALVEPNPAITRAQMLQKDLDTLKKLNDMYDDALLAATNQAQVDALNFRQGEITKLQAKIEQELKDEKKKELAPPKK